ncbi:MAG: YCF48-related protein [Methanococcaceae archaeon]
MKTIYSIIIVCLIISLYSEVSSGNTRLGSYRWRNDDGDVYSATWKDSANSPLILTDYENIRLRFQYLIYDTMSVNISLGYKEDLLNISRIPITRSDTGMFFISPSKYLTDTMTYFNNQLLPFTSVNHKYRSTITFDSTESYRLISGETQSLYELEYSVKPTRNIKPGAAYFFLLFENGVPLEYEAAVIMTPPVSWFTQSFENKYKHFNYNFRDLSFVDENTGTIVGSVFYNDTTYSLILKTTNGGKTWTEQPSPIIPFSWLNSVCFTSADVGTAVGSEGTVLRTTNGGKSWLRQNSGSINELNSVFFTNADTGIVLETYSQNPGILRTTNGGMTWTKLPYNHTDLLKAMHFSDPNNGFIVGEYGMILKTTDAGQNWIIQSYGNARWLNDVFFVDKNYGFAVGYSYEVEYPVSSSVIIRTTDGGNSWNRILGAFPPQLNSIYFQNKNTGWVVGNYGCILKTTDGGTTWNKLVSGTSQELFGVQFVNENIGWAVGTNGKVLKTTNGGIATLIDEEEIKKIPDKFYLSQNYPNPFNPATKINYSIPKTSFTSLIIYDVLGKEIARLVNEEKPSGNYEISWNTINLASGIYFYQLRAGNFVETKKMILMR